MLSHALTIVVNEFDKHLTDTFGAGRSRATLRWIRSEERGRRCYDGHRE